MLPYHSVCHGQPTPSEVTAVEPDYHLIHITSFHYLHHLIYITSFPLEVKVMLDNILLPSAMPGIAISKMDDIDPSPVCGASDIDISDIDMLMPEAAVARDNRD